MTVTIFTPVRNGAAFLPAAHKSILAQTDTDWRHVILDGESDDQTSDLAAELARKDSRVLHLCRPDNGQYDALFRGIMETNCDIIGWLNADDLYTPWAIASIRNAFQRTETKWLSGMPSLWDITGNMRCTYPYVWRSRLLISKGWYHDDLLGCLQQESIFFRKTLLEELTSTQMETLQTLKLAADFQLWRWFADASPLVSLPLVLGGFRRHGANRSVLQKEAYRDELQSLEAKFLAPFIAKKLRSLIEIRASLSGRKAAQQVAFEFDQEILRASDQ